MSTFEKSVTFEPAYDKRDPDPSKNYGIHGVTIRFVLKGEKGATQFVVYTDWDLPHVQKEGKRYESPYFELKPMGVDIGYHSYKPHYESQKPMEKCDILGCNCYYDGSSLQALEFIPEFLEGGSDAVWAMLESRYKTWFEEGEE